MCDCSPGMTRLMLLGAPPDLWKGRLDPFAAIQLRRLEPHIHTLVGLCSSCLDIDCEQCWTVWLLVLERTEIVCRFLEHWYVMAIRRCILMQSPPCMHPCVMSVHASIIMSMKVLIVHDWNSTINLMLPQHVSVPWSCWRTLASYSHSCSYLQLHRCLQQLYNQLCTVQQITTMESQRSQQGLVSGCPTSLCTHVSAQIEAPRQNVYVDINMCTSTCGGISKASQHGIHSARPAGRGNSIRTRTGYVCAQTRFSFKACRSPQIWLIESWTFKDMLYDTAQRSVTGLSYDASHASCRTVPTSFNLFMSIHM